MAKRRPRATGDDLSDLEWAFLNDALGDSPPLDATLWKLQFDVDGVTAALWRRHRAEVLDGWTARNPGTRPSLWWTYDAPRDPAGGPPDPMPREVPPMPRLRVGGIGQALHEVSCTVPRFAFGIPVDWLDAALARHLVGIAVDPCDPPRFESEASYLERHGLLTAVERRRLKPKSPRRKAKARLTS